MTKAAAQVLGLMSIAADFGMKINAIVRTDSTAAMGMVHREGLGRTRHIQVQYLWIQEKLRNGFFGMQKVGTKENVADLFTKPLPAEDMRRLLSSMNMQLAAGRSSVAPTLRVLTAEAEAKIERKKKYDRAREESLKKKQDRSALRDVRRIHFDNNCDHKKSIGQIC